VIEENYENTRQDSQPLYGDLNSETPKYEAGLLTAITHFNVFSYYPFINKYFRHIFKYHYFVYTLYKELREIMKLEFPSFVCFKMLLPLLLLHGTTATHR
jgi:hypothetical protein